MDFISLSVFFALQDKHLYSVFDAYNDGNIDISFFDIADGKKTIVNLITSIVITDDASKAMQFTTDFSNANVIYIGDCNAFFEECSSNNIQCYDIWSNTDSDQLLFYRFSKLIKDIALKYDEWIYEHFLTTMIDSIPELIWFKTKDGAHMLVNKRFAQVVNKSKDDIRGRGHYYIWDISPDEYAQGEFICLESESEVMARMETCVFEEQVISPNGVMHLMTYKTPLYGIDGQIWGTVGIAHDIADFENMQLQIGYIFDNFPMPIAITDIKNDSIQLNALFRKEFLISEEEAEDFDFAKWFKDTFGIEYKDEDYPVDNLVQLVHKFPSIDQYYDFVRSEIKNKHGKILGHYMLFRNTTTEEDYKNQILEIANTDSLTLLNNRRAFLTYLSNNLGNIVTIIFIDLDHFKRVNDNFGHSAGDSLLLHLAVDLRKNFPDAMCARLGGDEFAAVFVGAKDMENIHIRADMMRKSFEESYKSLNVGLSMSFGISQRVIATPRDIEDFIDECDRLMYEAKERHHTS